VTDTQQIIVDALNGRNIAAADDAFHPDCHIHLNGGPKRDLTLPEFKDMLAGMLAAFPTYTSPWTTSSRSAIVWRRDGQPKVRMTDRWDR